MSETHLFVDTPIGRLVVVAERGAIAIIRLPGATSAPAVSSREDPDDPVLRRARRQLEEYFAGVRKDFDLPLAMRGTDHQRRVWTALCAIPYGATVSYADLAWRLGAPRAARAVGAANGKNPLAIVVPCHRVIGSSGDLVGYAGGLAAKRWLLAHERAAPMQARSSTFARCSSTST